MNVILIVLFVFVHPGPGVFMVYLQTPFDISSTYLHYRTLPDGQWTPAPGVKMAPSTNISYPADSWTMYSVESQGLEFVFNDGHGHWIHNKKGDNFLVNDDGIFTIDKDLNLVCIKRYPASWCPHNCSDHGDCPEGKCICYDHYYKSDCSKRCKDDEIICYDDFCYKGDKCPQKPLPGCEIFLEGKCHGKEIDMPDDFYKRNWQTPERNSQGWKPSYQDYSHLQGWIHLEYSADHKSCTVFIQTFTKTEKVELSFIFDGVKQPTNSKVFDSSYSGILKCSVVDSDGHTLELNDIDFMWNKAQLKEREGDFRNGQKGAIVELFGWKDTEIVKECEMIAKAGYLGIKNELNPWYFMYQPVSYHLDGRMGTRGDLRALIEHCRNLGLRIYADAVVNHMTGSGNDVQPHRFQSGSCVYWPGKNSSSVEKPSPFFTQGFCYLYNENTQLPPTQEYPSVPYGAMDFHCERPLNSWTDPLDLNAGWLVGLVDLHTGKDHVRERIADYFVDLLSLGFSGFRIDAFKHIRPDDMVAIITKFKRNLGGVLPEDFFFWGELLVGGEHDMLLVNEDSGYNFGKYLEKAFVTAGFTSEEILKLKLWSSWYPKEPQADGDKVDRIREVIQNDDHDQQQPGSSSRDMGDKGSVLVIAKDIPLHRAFEVKLFEDPFGVRDNQKDWPIRNVLSSYWFSAPSGSMAPPDGQSDCKLCKITCDGCKTVEYAPAFNNSSCGYEGSTGGQTGYTAVHRDRSIIMAMRKWMIMKLNVTNKEIGIPDRCT